MKLPLLVSEFAHKQYQGIVDQDGYTVCRVHLAPGEKRDSWVATIVRAVNTLPGTVPVVPNKYERASWFLRDYAELLELCALGCDEAIDADTRKRATEAREIASVFDEVARRPQAGSI